jgi:hypothetical protein
MDRQKRTARETNSERWHLDGQINKYTKRNTERKKKSSDRLGTDKRTEAGHRKRKR